MEQITKKLNRLPGSIIINSLKYHLRIEKESNPEMTTEFWHLMYIDPTSNNKIIDMYHNSLQACIDESHHVLKELIS